MQFAGMNYLAILIAAVAGYAFGAAWYMTLSQQWLAAQGKTLADVRPQNGERPSMLPFAIAAAANLVMAWVLAGVIGHLGPGQVTARNGLISGFFVFLGFVATTLVTNNAFQKARPSLSIIDGGHWLGVLLLQGLVIGYMGL
jgi:hypothetical protein